MNIDLSQIVDPEGIVSCEWNKKVWEIAAAIGKQKICYRGNMVNSREYVGGYDFLDGGIGPIYKREGIGIRGSDALAYILYKLGFDAAALIKTGSVKSLLELEVRIAEGQSQGTSPTFK